MTKPHQLSFMPSSVKALKTMLKGIMGSYDNPWDLLAELSQNSVDAIRSQGTEEDLISFEFDQEIATIKVSDTGTGIDPSDAEDLFSPFGTNKDDDSNTIGEKGVGLKYAIFSTRHFVLESYHKKGSFRVTVEGAADWLRSRSKELFFASFISIDNPDAKTGTKISLVLDDAEHPLLSLSFAQIKTLLLTKTAVGSTKSIWKNGGNEDFECSLSVKQQGQKTKLETFECRYLLPTDILTKKISIDEFDEWRMSSNPSDNQKRTKLKDKIIWDEGVYTTAGRDVRFWSCIMPSYDQWFKASKKLGIVSESEFDDYTQETHFYGFHPDICLATKGMPTTVSVEFHPRGDAGYKIQFFTIIEDDNLSFDIGRKGASVGPSTIAMYKRITQTQFSKMLKFKRFLRGNAGNVVDQFARKDLFNEIDGLPDLESSNSKFLKWPNKQEATVAAIFYEMMGKGYFEGFRPLITGYRDTYDLTGKVGKDEIILEFKYDLLALFKDFASPVKMFEDIDVAVIWELTPEARKKAKDINLLISSVDKDDRTNFPTIHHIMQADFNRPIEILEIRKLIEAN